MNVSLNQLHFMAVKCGAHLQNKISPNGTNTPIETLHAEFCKILLHVQRKTTNNACRAELGQDPLIIKTQKRAIQFWKHLKFSDLLSYHYQALQCQEQSKEKSPLIQLVLGLSSQTCSTNTLKPQSPHPDGPGAEFTNLFY